MSTPTSDDRLATAPAGSSALSMAIHAPAWAPKAVLTAAEVRIAEEQLFAQGVAPETLMELAGAAIADVIAARCGGEDVLVACGPGNNGGDGYVVARLLRERGLAVRVAALAEPRTEAARLARRRWNAPVEEMTGKPQRAGMLVDAVFGTGQTRPPAAELTHWLEAACGRKAVIVDLPTGIDGDTGEGTAAVHADEMAIVAIGALKPAHLLAAPDAKRAELILAPIGLPVEGDHPLQVLRSHGLTGPNATANKYNRGKVVVVGGAMRGAAHLAALGAQRAGAGYVELVTEDAPATPPYSLVRRAWAADILADPRIGAVAIGPGLADDEASRERLSRILALDTPVVLDAGALAILRDIGLGTLGRSGAMRVLTPHEGEFARLFGAVGRDRVGAVREAAARSGAIVLLKGAATIVAHPDGRASIAPPASPWLATAGTGDVLTGIAAVMLAQAAWHGHSAFRMVEQAAWLHARAAELAGPAMIADDLLTHLPRAVAEA